jgi:glycosyltransferase involved in cell wall biosynthesis
VEKIEHSPELISMNSMKILIVHNQYQHRGGEDVVREAEIRLLRRAGHGILEYTRSNSEFDAASLSRYPRLALNTVWSRRAYRDLRALLLRDRPDLAHFHNTFPLISPSAYYACADAGVPVVQTLHNYRLLCPGANLVRDGKICEECPRHSFAWPGVIHACYRDSHLATSAAAAMLAVHRAAKTWQSKVNAFIALTQFARQKFLRAGLPADRLFVKSNFVERDPGPKRDPGEYALYVGRCSAEKGVRVLLAAWRTLSFQIPLKIAGNGPLREEIEREIQRDPSCRIEFLGYRSPDDVSSLMHRARFLIVPSVCFENFPQVIAESFACGLPAVVSGHGAMSEIVADGATGLHFQPANVQDLAQKAAWAFTHPGETAAMGRAARAEFQLKYTSDAALRNLEAIYLAALRRPAASAASASLPNKTPAFAASQTGADRCSPS